MFSNLVAIVGRPNVGKSTLFNRLSVRKKAITHDLPGVTRDRKYSDARLGPINFTIVDTPGLEEVKDSSSIQNAMTKQGIKACMEADLILFVVDYLFGVTHKDQELANLIRKCSKNVILVANKCENPKNSVDTSYYKLGFGSPVLISAEHKVGMIDLCEAMMPLMNEDHEDKKNDRDSIRIAIVGRPNTGKSTYINKILDEERLVTSEIAGTTRDSIEIDFAYNNQKLKLIDTAGLRKRAKIKEEVEGMSCSDSIASINLCHVVVLMIDPMDKIENQDLNILNIAAKEGRGIIIAVNKCDLVIKENISQILESTIERQKTNTDLSSVHKIPIVYCSNFKNINLLAILDEVIKVYTSWNKKIQTSKLNSWLKEATENHLPPLIPGGNRMKFKYMTQINTRPTAFKIFANSEKIPEDYKKYLMSDISKTFGLEGFQIRMFFAKSKNPFAKQK